MVSSEIMKRLGKVITIIPAKGASKRLNRKNVRRLAGKPLLAYPIEVARASGICGEIVVSTEDHDIARIAREYGACVPFMRPEYLARDPYQVPHVCLHVLDEYEKRGLFFDTIIILLPTCPLLSKDDVISAAELYCGCDGKYLMSVSQMDPHYYNALQFDDDRIYMTRIFENTGVKHEAPVRCNGGLHIVDVSGFRKIKTYYGEPLIGYEMPWERSIDVDTERDLLFAEWLMRHSGEVNR